MENVPAFTSFPLKKYTEKENNSPRRLFQNGQIVLFGSMNLYTITYLGCSFLSCSFIYERLYECVDVQFRIKKRNPGYKEIQPSGDESNDPRMEQKSNKICPGKTSVFFPRDTYKQARTECGSQTSKKFLYHQYLFIRSNIFSFPNAKKNHEL